MPKGGKRRGAGRPRGSTGPQRKTLEKALLREEIRAVIAPHVAALLAAQLAHAEGLKYLVTRDKKTGKFIRVGPAMASALTEETIEVWEKDPSVQAFTDLMNRLVDKPKEQEQEIRFTGDLQVVERLARARQRLGEATS
jgi:hypothetical protein